jgi:hypothetical protein
MPDGLVFDRVVKGCHPPDTALLDKYAYTQLSDRICGKRLRPLVPILLEAMERHGHVQLVPEVRARLLAMSAATIDLDGRQPRDLTPQKLLEHSRLPLAWHEQRTALGFG